MHAWLLTLLYCCYAYLHPQNKYYCDVLYVPRLTFFFILIIFNFFWTKREFKSERFTLFLRGQERHFITSPSLSLFSFFLLSLPSPDEEKNARPSCLCQCQIPALIFFSFSHTQPLLLCAMIIPVD